MIDDAARSGRPAGPLRFAEAKAGDEDEGPSVRQQTLPLPWHLVRSAAAADFAHPAERELARILTYYRIRWVYEPTSFVLRRGADGVPTESFTPDFYLPEHRLYLELTTMRQRLVTRKNRKLRRIRELYPAVKVKLIYRREFLRLVAAYRRDRRREVLDGFDRVAFTEDAIECRVAELASEIAATFDVEDREPLVLLRIGGGARTFQARLADALQRRGVPTVSDRIVLTRYRAAEGAGRVRVGRRPRYPFAGRRVILVADVVNTGLTLAYLRSWVGRRGARRVEICALLDRTDAHLIETTVRFRGFAAPDELLVGYGLQLRRGFQDLPFIATLAVEDGGSET